jgi:hypothetical protein
VITKNREFFLFKREDYMNIRKIESEEEYQSVLNRVGELMGEAPTREKSEEIERLAKMLEEYAGGTIDDFEDEVREEEAVEYEWEKHLDDLM